jgi:signal transduction histidine kinase
VLQPAWHLPTSLFQAGLFGSAFLFLCLFPNGRFYPHWTRPAAIIWLGYVLLWLPFPQLNLHRATVIWPAVIFGAVMWLGVVAQLLRYRRISNADEKQQTKWVIAGFAAANFGLAGIAVLLSLGTSDSVALLTAAILTLALMPVFIPISIGVALLRYRLWQIDIILNRSLVYGGLSLGIVTVYALTVGTLSLLFQAQNSLLISLLATGLIAVLFQPVRERLQRMVNKMTFGDRDDPAAVLARLGQRLEVIARPDAVLPAIVETVSQALKLPYVAIVLEGASLRLQEQGSVASLTGAGGQIMAETGVHFDAPLHSFPLVYQTETIGELQVAARSLNELLSEADERVLRQVALQAGTAVHAIRLTHDLQQSRIRLVTTREEERRRLRRDLHDELGPLIASQGLKLAAVRELMGRDPETAVRLLDDVLAKNQNTVADVRRLVYNLRPPSLDELGLVGAIREHVQNSEQSGLKTTIIAPPDGLPPLSAAVEAAAYRIVLEAFTNVVRHAGAGNCEIILRLETGDWRLGSTDQSLVSSPQSLIIQIQDEGVGLRENGRHGIGLTSMRERAEEVGGSCEVVSSGKGVRVTAVLPLLSLSE